MRTERFEGALLSTLVIASLIVPAISLLSGEASAQLTSGLVGYWKFDEGLDNLANDNSGMGNTGTIHGAIWVDGVSGRALSFDGVDDYVEVPYDPSLDFDALTWAAWVKVDDTSDARGIAGKAWTVEYPGEWYSSIMPPTSKVYFVTLTNSGRVDLFGNTTLSTGTWYHVAGTYDGATMKIYVNGVEDGSASQSGSLHLDMTLLIGRRGRVGVFDGVIDEVRIYNRALSPDEILLHYFPHVPTRWPLIAGIVGAVVIIGIVSALYMRRRKPTEFQW